MQEPKSFAVPWICSNVLPMGFAATSCAHSAAGAESAAESAGELVVTAMRNGLQPDSQPFETVQSGSPLPCWSKSYLQPLCFDRSGLQIEQLYAYTLVRLRICHALYAGLSKQSEHFVQHDTGTAMRCRWEHIHKGSAKARGDGWYHRSKVRILLDELKFNC